MTITDITALASEPVTLERAKEFLRVDGTAEDALIADLITASRQRLESMLNASLISRRRLYSSRKIFSHCLYINHNPITQVFKVSTIDAGGQETEIPQEDYLVNQRAVPATLTLSQRKSFSDYAPNAVDVAVEIEAGYGASADDVPMPLRQALLLLLAQSYEYRGQDSERAVPMLVDALLMPYRRVRL